MKAMKNKKKLWPGLNFKDKQRGERGASSRRVTCREVALFVGISSHCPNKISSEKIQSDYQPTRQQVSS